MEELILLLKQKKRTLSVAESFTGGMFSDLLTNIAGSSEVFKGSVVCYSKESKTNILKIHSKVFKKYDVVSKEVAELMAIKCASMFKTDAAISFTGYAPPSDDKDKLSGVSYIGMYYKGKVGTFKFENKTSISREQYKNDAINTALFWIFEQI